MAETGLSSSQIPARNVGKVRNKGIELVLSHHKSFGDFSYNVSLNGTYNHNEIVDLGDKVDQLPPEDLWIYKKGGSIGDFYMYDSNGLYTPQEITDGKFVPLGEQVPEAGMIRYVDINGDGKIDAKDRTVVGNDVPKYTYGVNIELNYKNFSFSIMGQGIQGVKVYLRNEASQSFFDNSVPREWQREITKIGRASCRERV